MAKERKITYSDNDRAIVAALKGAENGLTLAEINAATGLNLVAGHIVSAMGKGLIEPIGEREIEKPSKRKVSTYKFENENAKPDGKAFTESQDLVLKTAAKMDGYFTLTELSEAAGTKVAPGVITSLVKYGNISKGEQVEIATIGKTKVKVYGFVADIPAAETDAE